MTGIGNYDYWLTTSDTKPTIRAEFAFPEPNDDQDDSDIAVTGATFTMVNMSNGTTTVDGATATLVDSGADNEIVGDGVVEYQLSGSETSTAGDYRADFTLSLKDGSQMTVPQTNPISVKITKGA